MVNKQNIKWLADGDWMTRRNYSLHSSIHLLWWKKNPIYFFKKERKGGEYELAYFIKKTQKVEEEELKTDLQQVLETFLL